MGLIWGSWRCCLFGKHWKCLPCSGQTVRCMLGWRGEDIGSLSVRTRHTRREQARRPASASSEEGQVWQLGGGRGAGTQGRRMAWAQPGSMRGVLDTCCFQIVGQEGAVSGEEGGSDLLRDTAQEPDHPPL